MTEPLSQPLTTTSEGKGAPTLEAIAEYVPLGFECRGCGGSAYNWLKKCAQYVETGEGCCADFREWVRLASEGAETVQQRKDRRHAEGQCVDAEIMARLAARRSA